MTFSGINIITLPKVDSFNFLVRNIVVNNTGSCNLSILTQTGTHTITFVSGVIIGLDGVSRVATYNTGEVFTVTGVKSYWIDGTSDRWYISGNGGTYDTYYTSHDTLSGISIVTQSGTNLSCEVEVFAPSINYTFSLPSTFNAETGFTGNLISDKSTWVFGSNTQTFNSFEQSLGVDPIICFLDGINPIDILFEDEDTDPHNQVVDMNLQLFTTQGELPFALNTYRTGLFAGYVYDFFRIGSGNAISGLFNGQWSGEQFFYQDRFQGASLSYQFNKFNGMGTRQPTTIIASVQPYSPSQYVTGIPEAYVNSFTLTASGEYLYPPSVIFTGYYMVTGIQEALSSLLFSSGCSGNLTVLFSGWNGSGASGQLITSPVTFSGVYINNPTKFYVVNAYSGFSGGTGYTNNPLAVVVTGQYANCYDVPTHYGYNVAWFLPFNTSGALAPVASYLTGEVLYTTGLVSGGALQGYKVTGLNITNIGSGYNATYVPLLSFIRQTGDPLISGASGVLGLNLTGLYNFSGVWTSSYSIDSADSIIMSGNGTQISLLATNYSVAFNISYSGVPNTTPLVVALNIIHETGTWTEYITGYKYFSTDTGFLKKKSTNITGLFSNGSDLSFLLTQDELDTFYSSYAFTNNTWTINIGDLDF